MVGRFALAGIVTRPMSTSGMPDALSYVLGATAGSTRAWMSQSMTMNDFPPVGLSETLSLPLKIVYVCWVCADALKGAGEEK